MKHSVMYSAPYYRWTWIPPFRERVRDMIVDGAVLATEYYCRNGPCLPFTEPVINEQGVCTEIRETGQCKICGSSFDAEVTP